MKQGSAAVEQGWNFDNSYARLPETFFTRLNPTPVNLPEIVIYNEPLAESLGLNVQKLKDDGSAVFAGNAIPKGSLPLAQAYGGHQFGHFTMLGDGRAILLGEQMTPLGQRFDIQLKGSGRTPYSRGGDGRASLGPMLREYIISEAMYGLGIPTTRSLAVVTTGESVVRETLQKGAILTRVAASHLRVGTFQYVSNWGTVEELRFLADYSLQRHFPYVNADDDNRYLFLLKEVIKRQAVLVSKWQLVGFVHGVMNTDNVALSGESIDYGPCAFMDTYDLGTVFSSIDTFGRYAYGNQPHIAGWNLSRFAETLLPLLHTNQDQAVKLAQEAVADFPKLYQNNWLLGMRAKIGLFNEESQDEFLIKELLDMMQKHGADYTNTFRALTLSNQEDTGLSGNTEFIQWYERWQSRLSRQQESKTSVEQLMKKSNPAVIPRNHRVEEALEAAVQQGNYRIMQRFLDVLSKPYDYCAEQDDYTTLPDASAPPYRTFCGT